MLRYIWHITRGVMGLQHFKHAAIAVTPQVANDKTVGRVAAGLRDPNME